MPRFPLLAAALALLITAPAFGAGCHFRATLGDRQVDLFGTRHVLPPLPSFDPVALLQGQQVVALEVAADDGGEPGAMAAAWGSLSLFARDLPITPAQQAKLDRVLKRLAMPKAMAGRLQPLVLGEFLQQKARDGHGITADHGADGLLAAAARERKIPVRSLERGSDALKLLKTVPEAEQIKQLLKAVDALDDGSFMKTEAAEVDRWLRCDVQAFEQEEASMQASELRSLLGNHEGGRTQRMAEGIVALSEQHPRVLAAVGAMHLFGPEGLVAQFRRRGYEVNDISARPAVAAAQPPRTAR